MNIVYLLEHVSEQLHTIVRHFKDETTEFSRVCKRLDLVDDFENSQLLKEVVKEKNDLPLIIRTEDKICHFIVYTNTDKFLIGPIILDEVYIGYNIFREDLFVCNLDTLLSFILLLHNTLNPNPLTKNQVIEHNFPVSEINNNIQEKFVTSLLENIETNQKHNSHSKEVRELHSIKNGDIEGLMKSWEEDLAGVHGRLAKDEERQAKNLAITTLILASRAAIDGGLHPEISYTIVDKYIYELEEFKDITKIVPLMRKAEIHYTELVRDLNKRKKNTDFHHPQVESAKDYILRNIHSPLTIKSIATDLNLNGNYLAEIFKKQENISIPEYILKEKINLSKNMLIYSNFTYVAIATNLGFSSQSYFIQKFKELTGLTPKIFRNIYGLKEYEEYK